MPDTEPLDPAAIKAEHRRPNLGSWCIVCWDGEDDRSGDWPCLPYRLAAALAEVIEQAEARGIEAHAAGDFIISLTEERDELADALAEANRKLAAVEMELDQWKRFGPESNRKLADAWDEGWRHGSAMRAILAPKDNPYRAALGGAK